eukprot:TRINITY_DN5964_c0_g1_i1.p1 TRINITY_DN5964_c0_g1~~TRINITY_DN5964_c0_g1_i1.p1  ORF type:complete len:449 (-),score=99.75 TRINITY_DN5964_c0_g1_i1:118-1464(-)
MKFWEITLTSTVQVALFATSVLVLFRWFLPHSKLFPLNTRNPFLTAISVISLSVYCLMFDLNTVFATTLPCWARSVVSLGALFFYNAILLRTFSLWFQGKISQEKLSGQTGQFLRFRRFLRDSYSAGYLSIMVLVFWTPSFVASLTIAGNEGAGSMEEFSYETFLQRCTGTGWQENASSIVYLSFSITWILQAVLLWKVREIQESLNLKQELRISCANSLIGGMLAIVFTFARLWNALAVMGIIMVALESYAAIVIPLRFANQEKLQGRQKRKFGSVKLTSTSSRTNSEVSLSLDYVELICAALGGDEALYGDFKLSLVKEFAVENLLFLEDVSKLNESALVPSNDAIRSVVDKFLASGAEYEVNCNVEVRDQLVAVLNAEDSASKIQAMEILNRIAKSTFQDLRHGALLRFKRKTIKTAINPTTSREPTTTIEVQSVPTSFPSDFVN